MSEVLRIENLNKNYHIGNTSINVLKDINLTINMGEFVSIMGPSGSGKSTLLYILGGLEPPSSGNVLINNKNISSMKDTEQSIMRRQFIGFVYQFYNLVPSLNVEENIALPLLLDGKHFKNYKAQVNKIMDYVGLTKWKNHIPAELSGGQQQRVAIARALVNEPAIILADEPTGNLDSKTGFEIMDLFKYINETAKKTIIQVTHSKESASYSKRIINIIDGRVCS